VKEELFDTRQFGHFYAPSEVIHFLIALADPRPGEKVIGVGLDPEVFQPAVEARIGSRAQQTSSHPTLEELEKLEANYDIVLCAPTFGLSVNTETGESCEEFWLKWSIGHLSSNGRLAIIVPTGLLSNYSQQPIRRFLLEESCLQAVLELPAGWAQGTATQASILFITLEDVQEERTVKMFRFGKPEAIPWDALTSQVLAEAPYLSEESFGKVYVVPAVQLEDSRLDAQYYDPKYTEIHEPDPEKFETIELADLVVIRSGERFSKEGFSSYGIPFIQVGNVAPNGGLNLENIKRIRPDVARDSRGYSQPGEILMTTAGTVGKVAFLGSQAPADGVCIDTSLRRLHTFDQNRVLPEYLALYLRSRHAQLQIERSLSGSVIRTLSSPNLGKIIVYLPSIADQHEIVSAFYKLVKQQDARLLSVFPDIEQMQVVTQPPELIQAEGAEQISLPLTVTEPPSLQEVVQAEFPFPIARAYTSFEGMSNQPQSNRLKALIDVSEAVAYYLYGMVVADQLRRLKIADADLKSEISYSISGYSMERRLDVIFHMIKLAKGDPDVNLFVPELIDFEVGVCSEIHNQLRNKYSHVSTPPEPWCEQAVSRFEPRLERLLQSLMPLKDYKLMQVTGLAVRDGRFHHNILSMMGNNPLFQSQVEELENPLPADTQHVILIDQGYNVLDLYPLFLFYAWESTGMQYHLCFLKQVVGEAPNKRLKVESTHGVGEALTETDLGLGSLLFM